MSIKEKIADLILLCDNIYYKLDTVLSTEYMYSEDGPLAVVIYKSSSVVPATTVFQNYPSLSEFYNEVDGIHILSIALRIFNLTDIISERAFDMSFFNENLNISIFGTIEIEYSETETLILLIGCDMQDRYYFINHPLGNIRKTSYLLDESNSIIERHFRGIDDFLDFVIDATKKKIERPNSIFEDKSTDETSALSFFLLDFEQSFEISFTTQDVKDLDTLGVQKFGSIEKFDKWILSDYNGRTILDRVIAYEGIEWLRYMIENHIDK